jgi:acyl-CoA dehydrogenase
MHAAIDHLAWPFFDDAHRALATSVTEWTAAQGVEPLASSEAEVDDACRAWVRRLGDAGFLRYCVPAPWGGALPTLDSRALCVLREALAAHDGLADFAFAMQGLGSGAITLGGSDALRTEWLPRVASGSAIAAFALSEPDAGSDVAAMRMRSTRTDAGWQLDGAKTWISNGGIADFYCVFARTGIEEGGAKGISAFFVQADTPGLHVAERITVMPNSASRTG